MKDFESFELKPIKDRYLPEFIRSLKVMCWKNLSRERLEPVGVSSDYGKGFRRMKN